MQHRLVMKLTRRFCFNGLETLNPLGRLIRFPRPAITLSLILLIIALSLAPALQAGQVAAAARNQWLPSGPHGVKIKDIVINPQNNNVLYAAVTASNSVYKSIDAGLTWFPVLSAGASLFQDLAIDPVQPNNVYMAGANLYKTTNSGLTWQKIETVGVVEGYYAVAISPAGDALYIAAAAAIEPDGKRTQRGIFRSPDGGENWELLTPPSFNDMQIRVISLAPGLILAGGDEGVFRSVDNGATWQAANNGFGLIPVVYAITVDPSNSQVAYLGTAENGIYKSINGGESWFSISNAIGSNCIRGIQVAQNNPQVLYAAGGAPHFSPSNPGTPGMYRSLDNSGNTWAAMMDGMSSQKILSLAIDNSTPANLYAGTETSGIWKYTLSSGPEAYSISINSGALFTNQSVVELSLTAPAGTQEMQIGHESSFAAVNWEPFSEQRSWIISTGGDEATPRTVYARFKKDGLITAVYQDDILLDQTPPTGWVRIIDPFPTLEASLSLSGEQTQPEADFNLHLPLLVRDFMSSTTLAGLLLSAADTLSGMDSMLIATEPTFSSATWQPYTTQMNWRVRQNGATTIYVVFRDRAGNISPVYTDTVVKP